MNIDVLKAELTADPLARGYSGMDDEAAAADLNTVYRSRNRPTMTASEVLNAVDVTELDALAADVQVRVWNVLSIGAINPFGLEATLFIGAFGGGSVTITALQALRVEAVSRGAELGLGIVYPGHVQNARF